MGIFVRTMLIVAGIIAGCAALLVVLKLFVLAALVAAVVVGGGLLVRGLRALGSGGSRRRWVTTLTARR